MKIKSQTDQQMELYDPGAWVLNLAVVLIILGSCLIVLSLLGFDGTGGPSSVLLPLGVAFLLFRVRTTIIFDKVGGKVKFFYKSIIRLQSESYSISEITSVEFRFIPKSTIGKAATSGGRRTSPVYLKLVLSKGSAVVIGDTIWSNPNALFQPDGSWRPQIGQQIATFLGVPYIERSTDKAEYFSTVVVE